MIRLAVFFCYPGKKYVRNRHNAGRMLAGCLPFFSSLSWQKKYKGLYASHDNIHFLMPETYMNLSGESVFAAASFFKIKPEEIIIIHDELELPLGTISLKYSGGLGGHNGLRSMRKNFDSADFWRLRIGISRPDSRLPGEGGHEGSGEGIYDWVLSDFAKDEKEKLYPALTAGAALLQQTFSVEPETLLDEWKKKKINADESTEMNQNDSK
jgi:PTH1 family peptidyl-tRNA hydrolase